MRKTLAFFTAVIILLISFYCGVFAVVNREKENVVISENYVYGDRKSAENVTVNLKNIYKENLLWDTTYNIGKNKAETEFSLYKNRIPREYEYRKHFQLHSTFHQGIAGSHGLDRYTGLNKAYSELIESAEPHVETEKLILLSDYLDYYPLNIDITFPDVYSFDSSMEYDMSESEKDLIESFREFFRIPIMKDHKLKIRVTVGDEGNIYSSGTTSGTGLDENEDSYGFYTDSVITDNECFLYFGNRSDLGYTVDTSLIPGGYGIYRLPYSEKDKNVSFDFKNLKNIYPIDSDYTVSALEISEDKKSLYMVTKEENKNVFTIIDAETFETKERTIISEDKDESAYPEYIENDFIIFNIYHPNREAKFSVYSFDEKGKPVHEITAYKYIQADYEDDEMYIGTEIYEDSNIKALWNGEKLYVVHTFDNTSQRQIQQNGFKLAVYGKDGMQFYGEYITGLSTGNDGYFSSSYHIYTSRDDTINLILD